MRYLSCFSWPIEGRNALESEETLQKKTLGHCHWTGYVKILWFAYSFGALLWYTTTPGPCDVEPTPPHEVVQILAGTAALPAAETPDRPNPRRRHSPSSRRMVCYQIHSLFSMLLPIGSPVFHPRCPLLHGDRRRSPTKPISFGRLYTAR